jgi:Leu/Phe-tRNA-protein transferase
MCQRHELESKKSRSSEINYINNQAKYYNEKHTFRIFNVENKILLNFRNIHISKSLKKFDHKYHESFKIEEFIEKQVY